VNYFFFLFFSAKKKPVVSIFTEPRITEKSQHTYIHFIFVFEVSSFLGNLEEMAFKGSFINTANSKSLFKITSYLH